MQQRAEWVERMRRTRVAEVALAFGRKLAPARGASGGGLFGCPGCGAERRHPSRRDRRPAAGFRHDGRGFHCFACELKGDSLDLVALCLSGRKYSELHKHEREEVKAWCCRWLSIELTGRAATVEVPTPLRRAPVAEAEPPPLTYPPAAELNQLWKRTSRVDADPRVCAYLRTRGLSPRDVADKALAVALSPGQWLPRWASRGRASWLAAQYRLAVPLYDHLGEGRSVLARSIDPGVDAQWKSTAPRGFARSGLLMACKLAREVLRTAERPASLADDEALRIVIAEGEIDFLAWATRTRTSGHATLAIYSGSWDPQFAARIPDDATVLIATDLDDEGEKYAARIADSFVGRAVQLIRWGITREQRRA